MSDKKFSARDAAVSFIDKAKEILKNKLEELNKAEIKMGEIKDGAQNEIEEIHLPEGQMIPKTKDRDGFPLATDKQELAKANPANRTSAQAAGLSLPEQPKPPKAQEKVIVSTASKEIKPPKMPTLGAGLKKFMHERGEKLGKAQKGVHDAFKPQKGISGPGALVREAARLKDSAPFTSKMAVEEAKGKHQLKLKEMKAMPKPDLGKSDEKGVHKPFGTSPNKTQDRSIMGHANRGHWSHGSPERNKEQAVKQHEKVMSEMKEIKPKLDKSEHPAIKAYNAAKQSEAEAKLKSPEGEKARKEWNEKQLKQAKKPEMKKALSAKSEEAAEKKKGE